MRVYSYRCHDFSLLTPGFKKWLVAPLLPYIPWVVPANIITIVSNLFVYAGLFVALHYNTPVGRALIAVCLLLYLVGDHLDGMQAKRTQTGSALGEFCDHYLDAFNNGTILFTAFVVFRIESPLLVASVLTASYLAHLAVFYEQFKTGWLTFEKLGSLEAVLLISILVGASAFAPVHLLLTTSIVVGHGTIDILFLVSGLGALATFVATIKRTPQRGNEVWLFVLGLAITAFVAAGTFNILRIFLLITLYASLYVGLVMRGHLVDGVERGPDLAIPGALLLFSWISPASPHHAFWVLALYLMVRIIVLVFQTFNALKAYWVWSNPRT
ncbi:MAG: CDP-alcohol phosphatidyltransferase family protein [Cyclobacteriaceae bacterium]|nr:CDP-alcohol phosphatidyltransferase family protein [Cyclobacteriaceae bacterium]MCB0500418.1 CDP-alcohol phosphatidyltransferase family protein [Cyclobacteriaceae bacterium]MCB9236767.1 CDP-alcohol phosphatidyltransferase family protein [Flammeovirgaceae bacterium]MCO5272348.1 CDP-alcohol phosphatidyltransferase family protein [Cyclobacteriaceae bacterium]MCW5902046.1 CDP-alcohol phosphatidyltransferase family protein [Cyclobacteriaceae bacterium]